MELDDILATASDQINSPLDTLSGVPSYLIAANGHQTGANNWSLFSPSTWGDAAIDTGKFAASAVVRGIASTYNIVPSAVNWLGGNIEEADTATWLGRMDSSLENYYLGHQQSVNVVGDIAASFIPGLAGVKVLNMGRKALDAYAAGKSGFGLASITGILPSAQTSYGLAAAKEMAATSQSFTFLNANVAKSLVAGYGSQVLEAAAFQSAAMVAMHESPLFDEMDAKDILWNSLGGGLVFGGIMGSISAAKTYGTVKSGVKAFDKLVNPASKMTALGDSLVANDRIALALQDIHFPPSAPEGESEAVIKAFNNKLITREDNLWNQIRGDVHSITGDKELGNMITDSLKLMDYDTAISNIQYLQNIGRLGKESKLTALEILNNKILNSGEGVAPNLAVNYLKLSGEGANSLLLERPPIVNLADTLKDADAVKSEVRSYKFKSGQDWSPATASDHFETEARQIWASTAEVNPGLKVGANDLPLLERMYQEGFAADVAGKELSGPDLLQYIKDKKGELAVAIRDTDVKATTEEIAKKVNVKRSFLEGDQSVNAPTGDWFAFQDHQKNFGTDFYTKPTWAKLAYDVQPMNDLNGFVMDAISVAKARQKEFRTAANNLAANYFGEANDMLPAQIGDRAMATATRYGPGGNLFSGQNENYGQLGSIVQQIGNVFSGIKKAKIQAVDDTFNSLNYHVLNDSVAREDIVKAYNLIQRSPEKYIFKDGELVMKKVAEWEEAGGEGALELLDKTSPQRITINSENAAEWLTQWIAHNDQYLDDVNSRLSLQLGTGSQLTNKGTVYIPAPDPKNFPHFAFVIDPTVTSTGHVRMIHAASSSELESLIAKVDQTTGLKVVTKSQSEMFHKAMRDYSYDLGINENYINTALHRTGNSGSYFAVTSPEKIIEEVMDWRKRMDVSNAREYMKLKYAPEMETLNQLSQSYDNVALSKKAYTGKFGADAVKNPYSNYVKTMLDVSSKDEYPIWTPLNRLVENAVSGVVSRLQQVNQDNGDAVTKLDRMKSVLDEAGIHANFSDTATMLLANHTAPKPVLENFIRKANSIMSFLMLRSDPLNAVNNGLGHTVLYGTETRDLVKNIMRGNQEAAGALADLAHVQIPGKDLGAILSPQKLATNAYKAWVDVISGKPEMKELEATFRQHGWMPSFVDQEKSVMEALTLQGTESELALGNKIKKAAEAITAPVTKLNQHVEDMNRFVSAYTAKSIADIGVQAGVISADDALSYINTFVNRTQGNYIASQRPMLFTGPVGQAVGLFQTYQFNLMQQLFRYVAESNNKSAAMLLGLQGTVYGMNGLPAFNAINTHLVGNAAGNVHHKDVISQTYDTVGKEAGDWLLYGLSSNLFLHPDLKVNLYSRGDINPRQVTVIPTTLADVPVVGGISKLFQSIKGTAEKIGAGADVYSSILQGIEHAGISRPLAGLAQTAEAFNNPKLQSYSTTSKGNITMSNDLFSLTTLARLAGGRPLDEAIANDAMFRVQSYAAARHQEINTLGEALKTKVQTGQQLTPEEVNGFMREYVERGGKQEQFSKFMMRLMLNSNTAQANQLSQNLKNPGSQYMQTIMGGYKLQDLVNQ